MNRSYRLKTNIGSDHVLNVNLKQDIDIYEILTLKLGKDKLSKNGVSVENMYKTHSADYGVIVGRVMANDAFGVPNAKVSVFIPLSKEDKTSRRDIRAIYPFNFVTDVDKRNVKYNTLPNYKKFECHQPVGSFPNKRLVLDEDSILELYDKYYKYTTVTNNAGDYMLFGVPTGEQILHMDVDLSDVGILSQEPRDFIYKGYSPDLFESPTKFKKSTNLDNLPQIQNQSTSVNVYPLWGDRTSDEIAITRKDITLQYKFEPTCVFMGSVMTDNGMNSISYNCVPDEGVGEADQLVASKGDIEMIRKTIDDTVEEYQIKGNQLIDADGTWCYQIPMNLDYVGTDECGNIVPTNNANKGIPTRARVRFRITLDESSNDSLQSHKARYLIPNNPDLYGGLKEPHVHESVLDDDSYYEFGTFTPDECFRDLYWNKVYSVKNYIPRIQMSRYESTTNYFAIKGVNKKGAKKNNLIPYNRLNANLTTTTSEFLSVIWGNESPLYKYWPFLRRYTIKYSTDEALERAISETDGISLDFYNDWLNGCLYFPSWIWHMRKKYNGKNGEYVYENTFCECEDKENDLIPSYLYLFNNSSLVYSENSDDLELIGRDSDVHKYFNDKYTTMPYGSRGFSGGIIKKITNKDGFDVFYYSFGNKLKLEKDENVKSYGSREFNALFPDEIKPSDGREYYKYVRLFSTDIILLGSLNDFDLDGVPKIQYNFPSTTAVIPPIGKYKNPALNISTKEEDDSTETDLISYNGMNWGKAWYSDENSEAYRIFVKIFGVDLKRRKEYKYHFGSGLFFGTYPNVRDKQHGVELLTDLKSPVNVERICELGVTVDSESVMKFDDIGNLYYNEMDGLITKREMEDVDVRSLFATLNHNKLIGTIENYITGYKKYNLTNLYPSDFDGRLENIAKEYTTAENEIDYEGGEEYISITKDYRNKDYLDFRFGSNCFYDERIKSSNTYRSLLTLYDINKKRIANTTFNNNFFVGNNGVRYRLGDGIVNIDRFTPPKTRHFYGFTRRDNEFVYPLDELPNNFPRALHNVFPLYDNSFYFFFGLNISKTAIEKFYENFYSICEEEKKDEFVVKITTKPARAYEPGTGIIEIDVEEISLPYKVEVRKKNQIEVIREEIVNINSPVVIDDLDNGEYIITITDSHDNYMEEEVILDFKRVELETSTERSIMTQYLNQSNCQIYNNDLYAKWSFNKYTLYGVEKEITSLDGSDGHYTVNNEVEINIIPESGEFADYICEPYEKDGKVLNICKPGIFDVEICELSDTGQKCINSSYYNIPIDYIADIEMYINGVPLKYVIGEFEAILPYNKYFHNNGEAVGSINDTTIKGWFGVHNPYVYSDLFNHEITNSPNDSESLIWFTDAESKNNILISKTKFKYMFSLSDATYVTSGNDNKFSVTLGGGTGNLLLRSAMPIYENFNNKYVTGERNVAACNEKYPNIVSENYDGVNSGYAFNPKYSSNIKTAGNYFAGFTNNANIVQTDDDECTMAIIEKPIQKIPAYADPITGLCLNREENEIKSEVCTAKKYFRTEFIDRRFDYDVIIITGHKCNHFGEDGQEKEIWSRARLSAKTYNGIEMLYEGDDKFIISPGDSTEYKYYTSNAKVTLNVDHNKTKRFYKTTLDCVGNGVVDFTNAFYYKGNNSPSVSGTEASSVAKLITGHTIADDEFKFFGFYAETAGGNPSIHGYPSKRWLDCNKIPYNDVYTFTNISCGYKDIEIETNKEVTELKAKAVPGEVSSFMVDGGEIVNIIPVNYEKDEYNISFKGTGNNFSAHSINEISFRIIPEYVDEKFETKTVSINIYADNNHETLENFKKTINEETININGNVYSTDLSDNVSDTTNEFKNKIFKVTGRGIGNKKYLTFFIDRIFTNITGDFLKKKIRVINASTIYNVSNFTFTHNGTTQVDYTSVIPPGEINIDVDAQGSGGGSGDGTATNGDETYPVDVQVSVSVNTDGNGTNQEEVEGKMKKDFSIFTISSSYLANCIDDIRLKVTVDSITANYSVGNGVTILERDGNGIKIGVLLSQHNKLIKETADKKATIKAFLKIVDEIKATNVDGYLVFSFDYTYYVQN